MCGRYTRSYTWRQVHDFLSVVFPSQLDLIPSYNVAPTQESPVVCAKSNGRPEVVFMCWGLIPSWAVTASAAARTINARAEPVATGRVFRSAFRSRPVRRPHHRLLRVAGQVRRAQAAIPHHAR